MNLYFGFINMRYCFERRLSTTICAAWGKVLYGVLTGGGNDATSLQSSRIGCFFMKEHLVVLLLKGQRFLFSFASEFLFRALVSSTELVPEIGTQTILAERSGYTACILETYGLDGFQTFLGSGVQLGLSGSVFRGVCMFTY